MIGAVRKLDCLKFTSEIRRSACSFQPFIRCTAGRQTGSEAWRAARGELGNQAAGSSGKQATAADPKPSSMQAATNASEILASPASATPQTANGRSSHGKAAPQKGVRAGEK